ncbi:MAG: hypothetical protein FWB76_08330 [Oscillospiraceae bacterium]|nr:hypothetical protein [Oscillospiraceae bacterium]
MTSEAQKQRKIDSIDINFAGDTELPALNQETLDELGTPNKPVILKKNIIEKNLAHHPEIAPRDYKGIIGHALYRPENIITANQEKGYYIFLSRLTENSNSSVLLDVRETTTSAGFEIVNLYRINNKTRQRLEDKAKS